jgi:hypothetical protein
MVGEDEDEGVLYYDDQDDSVTTEEFLKHGLELEKRNIEKCIEELNILAAQYGVSAIKKAADIIYAKENKVSNGKAGRLKKSSQIYVMTYNEVCAIIEVHKWKSEIITEAKAIDICAKGHGMRPNTIRKYYYNGKDLVLKFKTRT